MNLETGDPGHRAGGSTDLSREIWKRGEVITRECGLVAKPRSCQLHSVAGISGESDSNTFDSLGVLFALFSADCHAGPSQGWLEPARQAQFG
jgi:hypothetical protein